MFDKLRHSKLMFWSVELLVLIFVVIGLTQVSFFICTGRDFLFNVTDPDHFGGILVLPV